MDWTKCNGRKKAKLTEKSVKCGTEKKQKPSVKKT